MTLLVVVLAAVVACTGGVFVGFVMGRMFEHTQAELHRSPEPYEILAELRGPLGLGRRT